MLKAFKYRLVPTAEQVILLNKHFGCTRFVFNWALAEKIKVYQTIGKSLTRFDLSARLTVKKAEHEWLKEVNSQSLQAVLKHLDSAYTRFLREKKGFPRFKKKQNRQSFECPQNVWIDDDTGLIKLPKIGKVRAILSRKLKGSVRTVTVSKTPTGKFFVSVVAETHTAAPKYEAPDPAKAIGIDVGIKHFATLSTGEKIANPKFLSKCLQKLRNLQYRHSKKKKGGSNRNKSRLKVARLYEKVSNQRNDFLHKVSTRIVRENQSVCVENLNIIGMVRNHKLAQAVSDVSWGRFVEMLKYKCEWQGKRLLQIGMFEPSSRLCTCGTRNSNLTLKDRVWLCGVCGAVHERDTLAANNIVRFAFQKQNKIGWDTSELTLGETVAVATSENQESHSL
ncbi:RNA-guided endonuclease TnpB family protein [Pontibacter litorisediminis]|uniref:RNA-guided endonuclease TnpB family protein n=1 Tax=Pontibacter litorisediminis TaxID=1846260 RepID=UPI0023EC147C|nr:RNA-guided endonuclease TnpB family protein [Pontibacter litorisediminis]